jgi:ribosome biogenesis protein SSF1/2
LFQDAEQAAVKLTEIGPRMRLSLVKIEEGFCCGEILYHKHVKKTPEEIAALRADMKRSVLKPST